MDKEEVNVQAFLKLIKYCEHRRTDPGVYYLLYGGRQTMSNTNTHPNKMVNAWGGTSNAAGAYQIVKSTYDDAIKHKVCYDFSPASQDKIAIWLIKRRRANFFVEKGNLEGAIPLLRKEWTSLPGAAQSKMPMGLARQLFDGYVEELNNDKK